MAEVANHFPLGKQLVSRMVKLPTSSFVATAVGRTMDAVMTSRQR